MGERLVLPSAPASLCTATRPSLIVCRHTTNNCERVPTGLGLLLGPSTLSGHPPIHFYTSSACPPGIHSKPCSRPLLLIWIHPRSHYPLLHRYVDILVAIRYYPSDLLVCATETGTPGFSLCPPVSVRQYRLPPCAELPPMQGSSFRPLSH